MWGRGCGRGLPPTETSLHSARGKDKERAIKYIKYIMGEVLVEKSSDLCTHVREVQILCNGIQVHLSGVGTLLGNYFF